MAVARSEGVIGFKGNGAAIEEVSATWRPSFHSGDFRDPTPQERMLCSDSAHNPHTALGPEHWRERIVPILIAGKNGGSRLKEGERSVRAHSTKAAIGFWLRDL